MSSKSEFDPQMHLSNALMDMQFENSFVEKINQYSTDIKGAKIVHISQGNCYCEWLAQPHQKQLDRWASSHDFGSLSININDAPKLLEFVPSTPAIVAIDENDNLIYYGPYSRGSGCFGSTGEIDKQLSAYLASTEQSVPNTMVDTDATGCYCNT